MTEHLRCFRALSALAILIAAMTIAVLHQHDEPTERDEGACGICAYNHAPLLAAAAPVLAPVESAAIATPLEPRLRVATPPIIRPDRARAPPLPS